MTSSVTSEDLTIELLPEDHSSFDISFKMIVVGDVFVGKSCLTTKAVLGTFEEAYSATIGFEFMVINIKINDKVIRLQIWDTCGQEIYRSLINSFYRNASLAMMVYAIDDEDSFKHIQMWLNEIKLKSHPDIKVFLIGNKSDLEKRRVVSKEMAQKFKEENDIHFFSEASAKSGFNAKQVFIEAAKLLYIDRLKYKHIDKYINDIPMPINKNRKQKKRKKGGCCS